MLAGSARRYKLIALQAVGDVATLARTTVPRLTEAKSWDLVVATANLAGALWQISNPPAVLAELYLHEPEPGHAAVDFAPKLATLVQALTQRLSAGD